MALCKVRPWVLTFRTFGFLEADFSYRRRTLGAIFLSAALSFPFVSSWVSRFLLGCLHFGAMWEVCYTTRPLFQPWIIRQYPLSLWFWRTLYKIRHVHLLLIFARNKKVRLPTYFLIIFSASIKMRLGNLEWFFLGVWISSSSVYFVVFEWWFELLLVAAWYSPSAVIFPENKKATEAWKNNQASWRWIFIFIFFHVI